MSELVVEGLQKRYKSRQVVQSISLQLHSGQVVGLLGPNGAGKTTSFYMIVGLIRADAGKIILNNKDISHLPIHQRAKMGLAYLPQEPSIFRKMTVAENILAILQLNKMTAAQQKQRLEELLEDLHISHIRDSLGISLSGGERRRVEIARCLASNPNFILLDEPFAGIDPIAVIDIQKIVRLLKERNIGVLITDHNVRETLGICDQAYIVNEGRIFASGTPSEIVENESVREVYLGKDFRL
ncbi:MAG: LPS export ABC transporter ATP-binding protein [Candidatus Methylopumilus sp.]|jgi:lipopolysaccharide export system ATP-binding protein|nr:LPS export ABC transporter ATP-binding protein [Candidatus Methylopumilus sp.]